MERKHLQIELKLSGDIGAFTGIAAAFGNVDFGGDLIAPGAFAKTISEHKARGSMPVLLWAHDPAQPIGVIDSMSETTAGLEISGRLALDTQKGAEAHSLVKLGAMRGLSIGYAATQSTRDAKGVRKITEAELYEISFVSLPMNERAGVTAMKSATAAKEYHMENADGAVAENADIVKKIEALEAKTATIGDLEKKLADAEKRADDLELKVARPGILTQKDDGREMKSFATLIRKGREALTADEVKSLNVSNDTQGGYLAPAEFSAEVVKNLVLYSPVRMAARVGATASGSVILPKRTGAPTASWVGETETRPETQPTYGQIEIPVHGAACYIDISNQLLEDSAVNIASEVASDLGEEFGRIEGAAFVAGNGVKKPTGFLSDAGVLFTKSGNANLLTSDGLIDLIYAMAPFYRQRGVWMMNGSTLAAARKLKDGQGNYLWQPSYQAGEPETLLGRPVIEAVDMPDVAANAMPVVFGDFASGYRIYDRVSLSILRDPYSQATSGLTRFHARRRVGGAVVKAEAIRKLKIAA